MTPSPTAWTKTRSLHGCRNFYLLILPSLSFSLSFSLSLLLLILDRTDVCSPLLRLFPTQFRAKMDFSPKKGENTLLCSHHHTTVIAGPTCLIAYLLAPHGRGFSPQAGQKRKRAAKCRPGVCAFVRRLAHQRRPCSGRLPGPPRPRNQVTPAPASVDGTAAPQPCRQPSARLPTTGVWTQAPRLRHRHVAPGNGWHTRGLHAPSAQHPVCARRWRDMGLEVQADSPRHDSSFGPRTNIVRAVGRVSPREQKEATVSVTGFYSGAKMRTTVIVALAGSAAAFSPMMSMETGRRRIVQSGAAAVAAAPLLRSTPAAAKYDKVSCNAPSPLCLKRLCLCS